MGSHDLGADALAFVAERHLATLTTLRADGSPHVVAVGFTYDPGRHVARVITFAPSVKARNAARGARAAVSQVDGARWITLEGSVRLSADPDEVASAVAAYAARYRQPKLRDDRVVIEIAVDRVMGSGTMRDTGRGTGQGAA
jgi:PPOX class probable F420-dependent enzyme